MRALFKVLSLFVILVLLNSGPGLAFQKVDKLVLSSPFSPLAMPMAYILEKKLLQDVAEDVELIIWKNTQQLRRIIAQEQADFVSVPTNVASIFYNKGVGLKLLRVSIWGGVFYIVSSDISVSCLTDLKGQEIYIPFCGDQPDLMFQVVCRAQGLDPAKDFKVRYVDSPLDITPGLLAGELQHALMIEPAAAMMLLKGMQKGKYFKRAIDIQRLWARATEGQPEFPNAGVAALPRILNRPELVAAFVQAYDQAVLWVNAHPRLAAAMAYKYVKGVNPAAFEQALKYTLLKSVGAYQAQKDIENMFGRFIQLNPACTGGRLPDAGFYFKE